MKTILNFLILCCLFSCKHTPTIDFESETKKILALDEESRAFHFNKNAKGLVAKFSKDFLSINRGRIELPAAASSYQKFDTYFKSVTFVKWDNNKEPIIRFSDDATVAYAAIDKIVILKLTDENGKEVMDTTNFAWLSVYKKVKDQWMLDCIASTTQGPKRVSNSSPCKAQYESTYPFSKAVRVELFSYPDRMEWDYRNKKHGTYFDINILQNGKMDVDPKKIKEKKELAPSEQKELFNILYNATCEDKGSSPCFSPRHALVFYDHDNKAFAFIEICFDCRSVRASPGIQVDIACGNRIEDLRALFKRVGIEYGLYGKDE